MKAVFYRIILLSEVISSAKINILLKNESVELAGVELAVCRISRPLLYKLGVLLLLLFCNLYLIQVG